MASANAEVHRMFGDIVKMTQASAQTRDEAEGLEALDIDLSTIAVWTLTRTALVLPTPW